MLNSHLKCRFLSMFFNHAYIGTKLGNKQMKIFVRDHFSCCVKPVSTNENRTLRDRIAFRKRQAELSILIEVPQSRYNCVQDLCKKFGQIRDIFPYVDTRGKNFCLVEYSTLNGVNSLLKTCSYCGPNNGLPVTSSFLYYKPESDSINHSNVPSQELDCQSFDPVSSQTSVSMQMIKFHEQERISELNTRLRFWFCSVLENTLRGVLPFCKVLPYGLTINGFGCDNSCLNILLNTCPSIGDSTSVVEFPTKKMIGFDDNQDLHVLSTVGDIISAFVPDVSNVQKQLHSKMPLITFHNDLLGINCDITLNNISLIYLSELFFLCGELDSRVRPLIVTITNWASEVSNKHNKPGIDNLPLTLLVLFFLQTRPIPILAPFNQIECIGTKQNLIRKNSETLETLLKEFFIFLGNFSFKKHLISVYSGKSDLKPDFSPLYIQNPLNHQMNVSANVNQVQLDSLCEAACCALWNFEVLSENDENGVCQKLYKIFSMR